MVKLIAVSLWQNNHQLTCQAADFDKNFFNERQLSQDRRYKHDDDDDDDNQDQDQDDRDDRWGDDQGEDEDEDQSNYDKSKSHESGKTNKIAVIIMRN